MAEAALLFRAGPAIIDTIVLDVTISESHDGETEVTDHPVETGFDVNDHARPKPDMLTLEGVVSVTPLNRKRRLAVEESGIIDFTSTKLAEPLGDDPGYVQQAYQTLRQLRETGKIITVFTGLRIYDDMIMTRLSIPRDGKTGDALRFSASFKQIKIVSSKVTTTTVARLPAAHKKVPTGPQPTKETPPAAKKKVNTSIARDMVREVWGR